MSLNKMMKSLEVSQSTKIETNPTPANDNYSSIKNKRSEKKKVGSFMRRDKRKNTKVKDTPSQNEKTSS